MYQADCQHLITTTEQLESLYGAITKELDQISDHYRTLIEKAPFVVVATSGPEGLDCSPRGDPPGFVRVPDDKTVLIPDRSGNNRVDTLRNIVRDPRISLLFLIEGVGETIRVNGIAVIDTDPQLRESFMIKGKLPRSVITVTVEKIYFQCQKALVRAKLWEVDAQIPRTDLPSTGAMLQALSDETFDGNEYDRTYREHMKKSIY